MRLMWVTDEKASKLYAIHKEKQFYQDLVRFITSGPIVAMVIEGDEAVKVVRQMIGATDAKDAEAGTIRGDIALSREKNAIHSSDSVENGKVETDIFFSAEELLKYRRADESWIY
jgi:nucleoside-diphosphate kinase